MKENKFEKNTGAPVLSLSDLKRVLVEKLIPLKIHSIIEGQTGIGKTAIIHEVAEKTGRILIDFQAACHEAADAGGYPVPDVENDTLRFLLPPFLKMDARKKYILYLDELDRGTIDLQQALLGVFNSPPVLGTKNLSAYDFVVIVTKNSSELQDGVNGLDLDTALEDRAAKFVVKPILSDYVFYFKNKYNKDNIFLKFLDSPHRGECINDDLQNIYASGREDLRPVPRKLEKAIILCENFDLTTDNDALLVLQSIVGQDVVVCFRTFLADLKRLDPKELVKSSSKILSEFLAEINEINAQALLTSFSAAIQNIDEKTTESEKKNLFVNIEKLNVSYGDIVAVLLQQVSKRKDINSIKFLTDNMVKIFQINKG